MQTRICKHLRHAKEAYRIDASGEQRMDHLSIDLCDWLCRFGGHVPPYISRLGGTAIHNGDCDHCQCFEALPEWKP